MANIATGEAGRTGAPLIASDRVEGTAVLRPTGEKIGTIERVMIDKVSGRVAYAVMAFGGFLGMGHRHFTLPWAMLTFHPNLDGYVVNITEDQLKAAPDYDREGKPEGEVWSDRAREEELHRYYNVRAYWLFE
jgi:hypothetical protein